jgi:hypothetical protein
MDRIDLYSMSYALYGNVNLSSCIGILPLYYVHRPIKCPLEISCWFEMKAVKIFLN